RYSLIGVLGSGVGSTVYKAADVASDGASVAVKIVGGRERDEVLREFFDRETAALSVLRHNNIIRLLDYGRDPAVGPFLVLEYAAGGSLADDLVRARYAAESRLSHLILSCAEALSLAHQENIIHRDLKPSNILFDAQGQPKIA